MQATAAGAYQAFRLNDLFATEKMLWKGTAIYRAWLSKPVSCRSVRLILSMNTRDSSFQVFQREIGSVSSDLRPKAVCLNAATSFSSHSILGRLACLCRNQHRLQDGNIIGKVGGIKHG